MTVGQKIRLERKRKNLSQEQVAKAINTTKQAVYKYEQGIVTNIPADKIAKLSSLFGVTPAYLMGWDTETSDIGELSDHERTLIHAYREQESMRAAVDRLLGISEDDEVQLYAAAHSVDNRHDGIVKMSKSSWNKIKNAPNTDDDLM